MLCGLQNVYLRKNSGNLAVQSCFLIHCQCKMNEHFGISKRGKRKKEKKEKEESWKTAAQDTYSTQRRECSGEGMFNSGLCMFFIT